MNADELRKCAEKLADISETLIRMCSSEEEGPAPEEEGAQPALEEVRAFLADKSRKGFTEDVRRLLAAHGASRLSEIDPAEYAPLMKEAEGIGDA